MSKRPLVPAVDYRRLRPSNLTSPEFRHLLLLLYWPVYGAFFLFVERLSPVETYFPVYCTLDDLIPFCEWFVLPYLFWFVYLIGMHLYTLLFDIRAFRGMMWFTIVSYSVTMLIYLVFPTCQELRPAVFPRDNFCTRFLFYFYQFDTNTNVFPSIHVIGSMAVWCASWHAERLRTWGWRLAFAVGALAICASTVFLKQHSIMDLLGAVPVCCLAYHFSFGTGAHYLDRWA